MDFSGVQMKYSKFRKNASNNSIDAVTLNEIGEILDRKKSVAHLISTTMENLNNAEGLPDSSTEEHIYNLFKLPNREEACISRLFKVLRSFGIRESDPRLKLMFDKIKSMEDDEDDDRHYILPKEAFKKCIHPSVHLISQALRNHMIIPSWGEFCLRVKDIFEESRNETQGEVADYIPQLARQNPDIWGMSICTIDGQRASFGDCKKMFCVQSVSKAFNYSIVSSDLGADFVHKYVGQEPSGRQFNDICLDSSGKPHNPMINAGAIIVSSLIRNHLCMADRFDFVLEQYRKLAGNEHIGFNNATFLSERDTADRNYALSYYMKENNCFPPGVQSIREELDFYFQLCSLEMNCETASVMAATLANGGVCPLTEERCIQPRPCRDVLSLMYSCGMYDFSGKFAFQVGLPAKSGVSGCMLVVVPNLMGIALFSPRLDKMGNSARGVYFCQKLIEIFNFHNYDSLFHADSKKMDPRKRITNRDSTFIGPLMEAAKNGDLEALKRLSRQGQNMDLVDSEGKTALHVAAKEGKLDVIRYLVEFEKIDLKIKDRYGSTAIDEARKARQEIAQEYLIEAYCKSLSTNIQPVKTPSFELSSTSSECDSDTDTTVTITDGETILTVEKDNSTKQTNGETKQLIVPQRRTSIQKLSTTQEENEDEDDEIGESDL